MLNLEFMYTKAKHEETDFLTTNFEDCYAKSRKFGLIEWDKNLFRKLIRKRNLLTNELTKINSFDELKEFDIISIPTEVKFLSTLDINYEKNISRGEKFKNGIKNGTYTYSKNYGWIDMTHAGFTSKIKRLKKLYEDILNPAIKNIEFKMVSVKNNVLGTNFDIRANGCNAIIKLLAPLPDTEKIEIAQGITLSILKRLSFEFEKQQESTDFLMKSSFAEEDLPSNIINFYVEIFNYKKEYIMQLCDTLTVQESLWIFEHYKFKKNYSFTPVLIFSEGKIPRQLSLVKDIPEGKYWKMTIENMGAGFGRNKIQ